MVWKPKGVSSRSLIFPSDSTVITRVYRTGLSGDHNAGCFTGIERFTNPSEIAATATGPVGRAAKRQRKRKIAWKGRW
jgi:hypothetical protein